MPRSKVSRTIVSLDGYGQYEGSAKQLEFVRNEGNHIILRFVHPIDKAKTLEIPFRNADGCAVGSTPERGWRIPKQELKQLLGESRVIAGSNEGEDNSGTKKGKGLKVKMKTKKRVKSSVAVETNGNGKHSEKTKKPSPAVESTGDAAVVKRGPGRPRKDGTVNPAKVTSKSTAEAPAKRGRKPAVEKPIPQKGEVLVSLSEGLFNELKENSIGRGKPSPEKSLVKVAFKNVVDDGATRHIVLNRDAAEYLFTLLERDASTWTGARGGRFRVAAQRVVDTVREKFKIKAPNFTGTSAEEPKAKTKGKSAPVAEETPVKRGPGRPKKVVAVEEDEDEEEEEVKPKKVKKVKKVKKSKR